MTCEFLSGLTQLPFPSSSVVVGAGNITTAGTLYFFLTARNRAGWTVASNPVAITYPANSGITITLPPAARGLGTDFLRYSLSANTTNTPISAYQLAEWENYEIDEYTRRTLSPIALTRNEHINPAGSVAIPTDLPTGTDRLNGQHRLVIGGLPLTTTSSYYKYSQFTSKLTDGINVIEPQPGQKWLRTTNPYTNQIVNAFGTGGCAQDVRDIESSYVLLPPPYDPVQPSPVKGLSPIKLTWRNNSTIPLKAGTNIALQIRQGAANRTDSFNGKLILTLRGYTDGLGNYDRLDAGGINAMPNVDIDRVWGYTDDALGILTLNKDLPEGESVVYEIAPFFTAQQFQGNLAATELISTYLYPYTQSGKNVAPLWAITGDLVLPVAERMHVVPLLGAGVKVNSGSAIVKAYTFTQVPDQSIYGLTPNTPNQIIAIDGNGNCARRITPLGSEAIRAIVSTQSGRAKLGIYSPVISIAANGRANLTLTYPTITANNQAQIRSDYPIIGGDLGEFNPTFLRIFAYSSTGYYPALSAGASDIGLVIGVTQAIAIDSLGALIPNPPDPTDPLFGLFAPPSTTATPATGGTIPAGNYQFCAVYYYDGSSASKIDHTDPSVIRESELTIADLYLLNQGWGRPILNLSGLRGILRSDTFAWQHRPVTGGSIFFYNPDSIAIDDGISTFKPTYLTTTEPGRWLIRKSFSVTPVGIWVSTTTYSYLQQVTIPSDGSYLYINPIPSSGNPVTNNTYWQQMSFRGAVGIQGIPGLTGAITVGANPNTPALNASATYTVDSIQGLAIGQHYGFNNVLGTLLLTALPTATTATLQNIDATVGSAIAPTTKILLTGKTGGIGQTGAAGTTGATTVGTNPNLPAINSTTIYTVITTTGLAVGQVYGFDAIGGTLEAIALTATTVTLKNIDSIAGVGIPAGSKLNVSGRRGATGATGSPHVGTGAYNAGTTYNRFDEVDRNGASYYWRNPTSGNSQPPSSDWQLIADRGLTGAVGTMGATTVGVNPNIPVIGASNTYTVDTTTNLAVNQHYGFNSIAGSLLVISTPTATTVVLQNIDAIANATVPTATKLLAVGKTGGIGQTGAPGTVGAITVGTNPNLPNLNASANYTIDTITSIAIGQYYGFSGITGTLLLTGIVSATVITLTNIDATPNSPIAPSTKLVPTGKKGDAGSGGDMYRTQYDTNNDGVVDDSAKLANQLPGYYLDRANQTGTQLANTVINFGESVDDRVDTLLVMGSGMSKVYDDTLNRLTLSSSGGGSTGAATNWQLKTANYIAIPGDKLRLDATASDIVITLPYTPSATDADILFQRLELGTNKVLLRSGANKFNTQTNQDAVFAPSTINLIEGVSYVNSAIGWLNQHNRLTFQAYTPIISGILLTYASDGDANGLAYYLGTNSLTSAFTNPIASGIIPAVASSTLDPATTPISRLMDRSSAGLFHSNSEANPWCMFDLATKSIAINKYTIRNKGADTNHFLRNWTLEGTNAIASFNLAGSNAATWTAIDTRVNDATLVTMDQFYTLTANGSTASFRYLRFRQTGLTSTGSNFLIFGELEFYGLLAQSSPSPSTMLTGVPSAYSTSLWVSGDSTSANGTNQITTIVNSNSNAAIKSVTAPTNLNTALLKVFDTTVNANVMAQNSTNNGYLIVDNKATPIAWLAMVLINDLPNDNTVSQCIFGSANSFPWHPTGATAMYANVQGQGIAQNNGQVYIDGSSTGIGGLAVVKPATWTLQYWDMADSTSAAFDYIGGRDRNDQFSTSYWNGKFAEIIVGTALLPVADRNRIEGYLAWKYQLNAKLPAGHPHKNSAPA